MKAWQSENRLSQEQWLEVGNRGPQKGDRVSCNVYHVWNLGFDGVRIIIQYNSDSLADSANGTEAR